MKRLWPVFLVSAGATGFAVWRLTRPKARLFDRIRRTDLDRKKLTESSFTYLNRSARRGSAEGRALMETWLSRVPASEHAVFCRRFRCGEESEFTSALQELMLRELLRRQRCKIEVHPKVPGATKQPDFRVWQPRGAEFVLEACTSTKIESGPDGGTRARRVKEFLHTLSLPQHLIAIDELKEGSSDLSQRALRKHLEDGIKAGVPGDLDESISIPLFESLDGWRIQLTAYAKWKYGPRRTTVMQEAWGRTWDGPSYPLRAVLERKASRYGQLGMPYVIAVNSSDMMHGDREFQDSLFGSPSQFAAPDRPPDIGFWGTSAAPKHTRVSAVLFTTNLCEATLLMGQVYACLYVNPWAVQPYGGVLANLPIFRLENGEVHEYPGEPLHKLLKLRLRDSRIWG